MHVNLIDSALMKFYDSNLECLAYVNFNAINNGDIRAVFGLTSAENQTIISEHRATLYEIYSILGMI